MVSKSTIQIGKFSFATIRIFTKNDKRRFVGPFQDFFGFRTPRFRECRTDLGKFLVEQGYRESGPARHAHCDHGRTYHLL